ncbi:MAG: restriction endonuclease subunit S [Ruminococcus sp.]|nr:restriction endonuclease subunit S [Ruminococcus sp.]
MNRIKLGDILQIKHGYAFKSENYVKNSPYALVTLANISGSNNFQFTPDKTTYYGAAFPNEFKLYEDDLIMPLTEQVVGLFGNSAFVPKIKGMQFVLNQRVGKVIPKEEKADKYYLHYLLSTDIVRNQLEYRASGTRQRNISPSDIYDVTVFIPDIKTQRKIGKTLYDIERKININNQINDNLQHQLKLLYDYWFTQFDFPDENGNPYRASGGAMVWNEQLKRKIPVNWKAEMLSDVFEVTMGSSPTGDSLNDNNNGIEFYQGSTDFGSLYPTERIYTTAPIRYAKQQDVLLSVRAPVGALNIAMNDCCIGRGLAAIHHESTAYAWCTLKALQPFFDIFNANGTTFGALTSDDLKNHYIISPDNDVLQAFIRISKPIEEKMRVISKEIRQLSTLRDWLLPMLMNGQATIAD